ncbi:carboxymuconolactone decarboxylase family protein [Corynebacterium sp. 320]|uniref:carboxymuconolactone decarboxylase family protein n=1 Tax=Corynebacterium TaxID=1716 RepID=UPI00125CB218|nr:MULTISPECIES: carboxymuconolactone decarboxylase family protein [Corynebacterium]KAB1504315.1 carboxymuconolactone decarboxylase family protein [Corynebacterium sp. 320]KAB1552585.1 carboxymuconolactone decarboxylase family protein [Corynebacterium sp. 321]KAB1554197.1 carboxymuconolactone decarboxylase family protein [Corynebacterium sp. 319]KAB3528451.1 carboxymuconolactone decarboxylase family protein [Corynebacterium sp. 250]KAB3540059.1 carboxymuconolactone decarboxylase family protein
MEQLSPLMPVLKDDELSERAQKVFEDIRTTRSTHYVNNVWRVLANNDTLLEETWADVKSVLSPDGELDVLTKQLIYIAVSVANGCTYCVRSHTAAARQLGLTDAQLAELHRVIGVASKTNSLMVGLQVPVDDALA